ncbi:DNA methyltransferase [Allomesorhizobium alhagi]|uniref:site-specific DNA-methyltransferase (adenine-specific) n=1 Tax=Mesorhizobium alhagi CCNWXJ12-2 TaxID=1107882 RepID=H0HQD5_9HYPH|nr:site-specific DNA-methyltransferase [Mesorhizobium alhagi]EHK57057.1 DNA methylase N-4/N-6 domain protein [Mesorhizobium alhagi CCNWXJ12-2]
MNDKPMIIYGPSNPHPLSQMRTELVWEGKYDEFGNRREVNAASVTMPLQLIETIDEPRSRTVAQGVLFDEAKSHRDDFRNRLVWGDNKAVMASLLEEFKGRIDLVYIDPPFDVGADFSMKVPIGDEKDKTSKDPSILEVVAYRDIWGLGTNSYASMLFDRITLAKELLSESGSFFLHCDWRVNSLLRAICNEVFGDAYFRNEIIWHYENKLGTGWEAKTFDSRHDTIIVYSRTRAYIHNTISEPVKNRKQQPVTQKIAGKRVWLTNEDGTLRYEEGKEDRPIGDVWNIPIINPVATERLDYPTQKPLALLQRVIEGSSSQDSIVADFFCGSGTTLEAAERLGRRWIGCDLGRFSVHTSRKRLIQVQRELHEGNALYRSFDVYNLGRYERQWWQKEALKGAEEEHRAVVLKFFRAEPLQNVPSPLIHGRKATAFVHVDGIDSIFSREEAKTIAHAVKAAGGKQVHCLAWDFEMDIRQAIAGIEIELDVKIRLHRIPREIMEKNRTEVPPFFEVALLEAEPVIRKGAKGQTVEIKLNNFLPSLTEVPSRELEALQERAVQSGFDFIDFWAIDFDWMPGKPFNHHWQDYRTRKDRTLRTVSDAEFAYANPGHYTACIKVVDVFGCDTSITVEVEI